MSSRLLLEPRLYFSYGQFFVYDKSLKNPGCLWTDAHVAQGFARRDLVACFGTLLEYGHANVYCSIGPFVPNSAYERAIAVPFSVVTGTVVVDGPDEMSVGRSFDLAPGPYELIAAQYVVGDDEEVIDLFLGRHATSLKSSRILVADQELADAPKPLVETVSAAG